MNVYASFALMLFLALVQVSVMPFVKVLGARPDLVLVAVIAWTLLRGARDGLYWAFIGGLILDMLSGAPFGTMILGLCVVALLAQLGYGRVFGNPYLLSTAVAFPLAVLYGLIILVILLVAGHNVNWAWAVMRQVLPSAILDTAAMPFFFAVLGFFSRRIAPKEML